MKKNNDIEKYINDNINAEKPTSLSKESIVSMLDENENVNAKHKDKTIRRFYKAVAVAAAFAVVLGGVTVYEKNKKPQNHAPVYEGGEVASSKGYDELYAALGEMHERYIAENKKNVFFDIYGVISGNTFFADKEFSQDIVSDNMVSSAESTGRFPETAQETSVPFGTTNTQEKGIDEGDIIKTDGKYIYFANRGSQKVSIVKATSGEMNESASLSFKTDNKKEENSLKEIYLANGKLIVIYVNYDYSKQPERPIVFNGFKGEIAVDMAYSCCCPVSWIGSETHVNVYDVSNPEKPSLIEDFSQSGDYISSRIIDGRLYMVTSYGVDISAKDYKDNCIPEINENGKKELVSAENITIVKGNNNPSYVVISTVDIKTAKKTDSSAVFGDATNVYATEKSLYVVEQRYDYEGCISYLNVVRFEFTDKGVKYVASARADGTLNSNLSMSEYGEYFRIATTCEITKISGEGENKMVSFLGRTNKLYVFDSKLNQTGLIDSFAEDELIRSARYIGNYAYVVTFRQTDPLFVINLSDPKNPQIESALKLPGFSSYLHPLGNGLLLGVGYDGDEENANGNMKVSLFSVADPKNPQELSKLLVGNKYNYVTSEVNNSYKAFLNLPNGEFAVPFSVYSDNASNGSKFYVRYKVEDGIINEIARFDVSKSYDGGIECGTYIGDYLYAIFYEYNYDHINEKDIYTFTMTSFNLKTNEKANEIVLK